MTDRTWEPSRVLLPLLLALSGPVGCAGDGGKEAATGKSKPVPAKSADGKAAADAVKAAADAGQAAADAAKAGQQGVVEGAEDGSGAPDAESGALADGESGESGDGETANADGAADAAAVPADPKALLKEVANRRIADDRATAALAEAEAAGSTPKDLARAAYKRGKALHATPDRAKVFFEWALAKDPKYPDPAFELAKAAVNTGELAEAIKHLTEVKARGGKKLLSQIDFDPMWDVVKDDPDVRKLLGG